MGRIEKHKPKCILLTGPAGSGKTHRSINLHVDYLRSSDPLDTRNPKSFFIAPTREHVRRISDLLLRHDSVNVLPGGSVATFNDFLKSEFAEPSDDIANDILKKLFIADVVKNRELVYFSEVKDSGCFLDLIADFISELKSSSLPPTAFKKRVRESVVKRYPHFKGKYEELIAIYEDYEKRLAFEAVDDYDGMACRTIKSMAGKKGRGRRFGRIIIDGFYEFTPIQYDVIKSLKAKADEIVVTLAIDNNPGREELFKIPLESRRRLMALNFKPVAVSEKRSHRAVYKGLAHLEENIFAPEPNKGDLSDESIIIFEATGIRGEMEMVGRHILKLYRENEGHRFSDFCVILRRVGGYEQVIRSVFSAYGIPVEIHERLRLKLNPFIRTVMSFLAIARNEWQREDLFRFMKSSYSGVKYEAAAEFELFSLEQGVSAGRDMFFGMLDECGGRMENGSYIRESLEAIERYERKFLDAKSVREMVDVIGEIVEEYGLLRNDLREDRKSREDFAAHRRFLRILDELEYGTRSGGGAMGFEGFHSYLFGAVDAALFSVQDAGKDRVQVYDISTARQKEYKVAFVAGLLQKQFPVEIREDPLLKDDERRAFNGGAEILKEHLPRQSLERYLFYVAVTRAREHLILSYPRFDLDGKEELPSFYVDEVKRCFSGEVAVQRVRAGDIIPRVEDVSSERDLVRAIVAELWDESPSADLGGDRLFLLAALHNEMLGDPKYVALIRELVHGRHPGIFDEEIKTAFREDDKAFSPTALETYGRCPYRYFMEKVICLKEVEESISILDIGTILHNVLEAFYKKRSSGSFGADDLEAAKEEVRAIFERAVKDLPLKGARRFRLELTEMDMLKKLERFIEKEYKEGAFLGFEPCEFEAAFGKFGKGTKSVSDEGLVFDGDDGREIRVRGKIDRVDRDPSGRFGMVVDYKLGKRDKTVDKVRDGLCLQLPLYILAIERFLKLQPAGGYFYSVSQSVRDGFYDEQALNELGLGRVKQAVSREGFGELLSVAQKYIKLYVRGIRSAEFPVSPSSCKYCGLESICRIEGWEKKEV